MADKSGSFVPTQIAACADISWRAIGRLARESGNTPPAAKPTNTAGDKKE